MNTTEWVAALTTLSSVIMLSKGKIAGWILGILGSFFYVTIFFEQNLFANLLLQIVFIVQGFYGIYEWKKDIKKDENFLSKNLNSDILVAFLFYTISFSLIICLSFSLYKINEILDITLSIFSILAMILMAKKYIQSWFIWIFVDIGYVYFFISTNMYISAILYFILLLICIDGFIKWKKKITQ